MRLRWLALAVAVLFPAALSAAVRCDFNTILTSPNYSYRGTLVIDGERSRLDIAEGSHPLFNPNTTIITRAGGKEIVMIDHARKTWFLRSSDSMGGHLSTSRGMGKSTGFEPKVRVDRGPDEHRLQLEYDLTMEIEGEQLKGRVALEIVTEFGDRYRQRALAWGLHYAAKTGFAEIDRAIARRMPTRMPSKQTVTASRQIEGGPVVSETITTSLANFTDVTIPDTHFYPPAGYRYEMPVFEFGGGD
jgi:hypothetical protein